MSESIAILVHIYYQDSLDYLTAELMNLKEYNCRYYFNLCAGNTYNDLLVERINLAFPGAAIIVTPNKGKDIGGKLALIDLFLQYRDESKYLILLHDKLSPHISNGMEWRRKLLQIVQKENISIILRHFSSEPNLGLIGAKEFIVDEYNPETRSFNCTNSEILQQISKNLGFGNSDFRFIGGTMFWVRAQLYRDFFTRHEPLPIRATLEHGNVSDHNKGTHTHAWERLLSWICPNEGFIIKGI